MQKQHTIQLWMKLGQKQAEMALELDGLGQAAFLLEKIRLTLHQPATTAIGSTLVFRILLNCTQTLCTLAHPGVPTSPRKLNGLKKKHAPSKWLAFL